MKTIHKFTIPFYHHGVHTIKMPDKAVILSAIEQYGNIAVYAIVDINAEDEIERKIFVALTGDASLEDNKTKCPRFLATISFSAGSYIVHVFCDS